MSQLIFYFLFFSNTHNIRLHITLDGTPPPNILDQIYNITLLYLDDFPDTESIIFVYIQYRR